MTRTQHHGDCDCPHWDVTPGVELIAHRIAEHHARNPAREDAPEWSVIDT